MCDCTLYSYGYSLCAATMLHARATRQTCPQWTCKLHFIETAAHRNWLSSPRTMGVEDDESPASSFTSFKRIGKKMNDSFVKNATRQAEEECGDSTSSPSGRKSLQCFSKELSSAAARPSFVLTASKSFGSHASGSPCPHRESNASSVRRRRRSSTGLTAELAAVLTKQLQQRMFGARQGAYAHSDAASRLCAP